MCLFQSGGEFRLNSETTLQDMPSYQHYVKGHHIVKTNNGLSLTSEYYKRYYSMIDAEIYFGDVFIEEAHDLQWMMQENRKPLFGYNSYVFDEMATGNRLISGQFTINFTGANVFEDILKKARSSISFPFSETIEKGNKINVEKHINHKINHQNSNFDSIWKTCFDLDIMCKNDKMGLIPAHLIIRDVFITSSGGKIAATGGAFQQQYAFIGRDMLSVE